MRSLQSLIALAMIVIGQGIAAEAARAAPPAKPALAAKPGAKPAAAAAPAKSFSAGTKSCTEEENWFYGTSVTAFVREKLGPVPKDFKSASESMVSSYAVKMGASVPEVASLADYRLGRAFYELKLMHLAEQTFIGLLASYPPGTPGTQAIKIAALACLNRIHRQYPSMGVASEAAASLGKVDVNRLHDERKQAIREAMATSASRKLFVNGPQAAISAEMAFLAGSGPYEDFVRSLGPLLVGKPEEMIAPLERFLRHPVLPEALKAQADGAYLNLAHAYYDTGKYDKAVEAFKKVKPQSNFYSRSLLGAAWAQMMTKAYSGAAGSAYNLLVGGLRGTFNPDASVIISMALFENCNNREARDALAVFRKRYDGAYKWLYDWNLRRRKGPVPLYPTVAEFLGGGKGVPAVVASEWIRSPLFIAEQQEMNLLFDGAETARKLIAELKPEPRSAGLKPALTLKAVLSRFVQRVPTTQQATLARIESELQSRTVAMIPLIVEAYETAQLIEVEIYNQVGDELTRKALAAKPGTGGVARALASGDMPVLAWGKVSGAGADDDEGGETWEDELGAIRTEIKDACTRKK
jgi:tetratricopeptide (TPR) repeat protein